MKYFFLLLTVIILGFSCNEKKDKNLEVNKEKITEKKLPIIKIQTYETALFDLQLQEDSLRKRNVKNYTATQTFTNNKKTKTYFHSIEKQKGNLLYCELNGKDTIISERILEIKNNETITEKKWTAINRKAVISYITNQYGNIFYLIEQEKYKKADTTKYIYKNKNLVEIKYANKDVQKYDVVNNDINRVTYVTKKKDTLFQYQIRETKEKIKEIFYTKKLNHQYQYILNDNENSIAKIIWKEHKNSTSNNAIIYFQYTNDLLPLNRKIISKIPAFGNSQTIFEYKK